MALNPDDDITIEKGRNEAVRSHRRPCGGQPDPDRAECRAGVAGGVPVPYSWDETLFSGDTPCLDVTVACQKCGMGGNIWHESKLDAKKLVEHGNGMEGKKNDTGRSGRTAKTCSMKRVVPLPSHICPCLLYPAREPRRLQPLSSEPDMTSGAGRVMVLRRVRQGVGLGWGPTTEQLLLSLAGRLRSVSLAAGTQAERVGARGGCRRGPP